ncbi:MAG: L-ribulose-5-phosphate 4-epimerase [Parcubacteria group bacterium GW2011_GWA1_40_21]|nr:MAG: L-ribulose-5-phosphate 4-epimerase [Parcubacteria group bacterium GW2011_GWC1_40_13]KKR53176.1 MAG: L-ribulose-5-phosphate 4-epimerase [Parcubacteria group bacterium GW2011_GWA1_40_21]
MTPQQLKKNVCEQNKRLVELGLVILTEGNVSQISDDRKYVVIKPSGIPYEDLTPDKMVVIDLKSESIMKGCLNPSSDTATHLEIYRKFPEIKGVTHTHSIFATAWAQTGKRIPCYGTSHADHFCGDIPITRLLTNKEIRENYELNTGKVINEILLSQKVSGVMVNRHGPFCFGSSAKESVDNSIILEKIAMLATMTKTSSPMPKNLHKKHYHRKHGKNKYYGQ